MENTANTPSLFDVVRQFDEIRVDDYQRTYAWTKDEIEDLFEDLKSCINDQDTHFFGSLILQAKDNSLATVVDGQQRLTTIFILVATLRDAIDELGIDTIPPSAAGQLPIRVIDKTWKFLYVHDNVTKHRFRSNRFITHLMSKGVVAEPASQIKIPDRESNLTLAFRKAVKYIRARVTKELMDLESKEERLIFINEALDAIFERFLVLRVVTQNLNESLEIFLTLNNRGLPLGASDLVRGEIMGHLGHGESEAEQRRTYQRIFTQWNEIADNVREPEVFLRHYLVSTGEEKVQKKKVHDVVAKRINDPAALVRKEKASQFWNELLEASETYNQIIDPKMGGSCEYHLYILDGLLKSHRIFMLSVLQNTQSGPERDELVRLTYVLSFRWVISGGNAQNLEDFFQKTGSLLREETGTDVKRILSDKIDSTLGFDVENYLREEGDSGFIGKAVLHGIARALAPNANPITLNEKLHLEHVAPQSSTLGWKSDLFSGNENLYDEYSNLVSEIGNLTLLDFKLNIQAKQKPFNEKKPKYFDSVMNISRDLQHIPKWDESVVQKRTSWVAECFDAIWSSEPNQKPIMAFSDWYASNKN